MDPIKKTEDEWKQKLSPEEYAVLRAKGTEAPGSGQYLHETRQGTYNCKACGNPLFASDAKFDSSMPGTVGWPSFDQALPGSTKLEHDPSYGMERTEVLCAQCGSHLGHIFDDHEAKTGKHFCVNSVCLDLQATNEQ